MLSRMILLFRVEYATCRGATTGLFMFVKFINVPSDALPE